LDRRIIVEDIKAAKKKADFVFISLHWGIENQPSVHPTQIEIAHLLIDEGADCIIGHHPHVPHGIEVYKERPIFYSLGNFIFAQTEDCWSDNILAEIIIDCRKFKGVIIYPISGQGQELFQPEILTGTRADSLLHEIQIKSVFFNTRITTQNHVGYISIS
jgi:poly-gamma-glutamate synthesis protein (capsule biosynthesis protein)